MVSLFKNMLYVVLFFTQIEDLAEVSLHDDLSKDYVGIVQRIKCIPVDTKRGIQVQRSAAHMAFQEMLDFDTVNLSGFITVLNSVKAIIHLLFSNHICFSFRLTMLFG